MARPERVTLRSPPRANGEVGVKNRIKELRKVRGLTHATIADALGVTTKTVQRLEKGESELRARYVEALAKLFEVDPLDIYDFGDAGAPGFEDFKSLLSQMRQKERRQAYRLLQSLIAEDDETP